MHKIFSIAFGVLSILLGIAFFVWRTTLLGDFEATGSARFVTTLMGFALIAGGGLIISGGIKMPPREKK